MRLKNLNVRARIGTLVALTALGVTAFSATSALALNPERHYELVSPVYKGGFGVKVGASIAVAESGESIAYASGGTFAGAPAASSITGALDYLARRGGSGWSTVPLNPPVALGFATSTSDFSPTLESMVLGVVPAPNAENAGQQAKVEDILSHRTGSQDTVAGWNLLGEPLELLSGERAGGGATLGYVGASPDLCHLFFDPTGALLPEAPTEGIGEIYELNLACGGSPASLQLLGVNDAGKLINSSCGHDEVGDFKFATAPNMFHAVSVDGGEVFFTDCFATQYQAQPEPAYPHQLFVRLSGSRTLEVSKPLAASDSCAEASLCAAAAKRPSADFAGASEDGSKVYFTSKAPLVPGDTDASTNLFLASIGCPGAKPGCGTAEKEVTSLVRVSRAPGGGEAGVQGVVQVSPDGSRVYFVAHGDLLTAEQRQALEGQGRPVPFAGAENLYVYDATAEGGAGAVAFVADLCSGPTLSGAAEDVRCPSSLENGTLEARNDTGLWGKGPEGTAVEAQTAGTDGRFLVFDAYAQLTGSDTNAGRDVYRYDASTGVLDRVSLGEGGYDANGNGGTSDAQIPLGYRGGETVLEQYQMTGRAVSEDGSRIVFTTSTPLSPEATNGLTDVYEWHEQASGEGSVSLISSGSAEEPVNPYNVVMSPSGNDVFFVTSQGLLPQDTDGLVDLYNARLGAGFPAAGAPVQPCSGDACQGPLTNPASLLVPGSVSQAPGGNLSPAPVVSSAKAKPKAKAVKCRKGFRREAKHNRCVREKAKGKAKRASNDRRMGR